MECGLVSSHRQTIRSVDVENAYLQGEKPTRTWLLSHLRGGIPDDNVSLTDNLLELVPTYGTKDSGRNFWKRLRSVMCNCGIEEQYIFKACYSYPCHGEVQLLLATHVDVLIWACKPSAAYIIVNFKSLSFWARRTCTSCGIVVRK